MFFPRPYLLIVHDLNSVAHPENFGFFGSLLRRFIIGRSVKNASKTVSISKRTADEVRRVFGEDSVVIYNPVRMIFNSKPFASNNRRIVCMTSLAKHKNVEAAYKACLRFVNDNPDVFFDFIGNWRAEKFPSKIRHPNIKLHGYVSNELKFQLLNEAACIFIPSTYEGFGMPYVEAMLNNKCLICSDIPIAREIAANYPNYITAPFGEREIYDALDFSVKNNFANDVFDKKFLQKFSPKVAAGSYINLIRAFIN